MKTLYIDCGMGAAGDMLTAALLELCEDREQVLKAFAGFGIPGVTYTAQESVKCGITGTHMQVLVNGVDEFDFMQSHSHEHTHEHTHDHSHGDYKQYKYELTGVESYDDVHEIKHALSHIHTVESVSVNLMREKLMYRCAVSHAAEVEKQVKKVVAEIVSGAEVGDLVSESEYKPEEHTHTHSHTHEHTHSHEHTHEHSHEHIHEHSHSHDHGHTHTHADGTTHSHSHSGLDDIAHIISHLNVNDKVKQDAVAVYRLIAEAESHAHGLPVTQVHFHEVGSMDAVADVVAVCYLIDLLKPEKIVASPVHVGAGKVKCAHGILPVPAPATAFILKDVPIYGGQIMSELCTPTGAALLKHFVNEFGSMPVMKISATGYGMGRKDFERANCVRVMIGESAQTRSSVFELSCNVDDMTAEEIAYRTEKLFEGGAVEVYTIAIGMKKGRPGTLIRAMCKDDDREKIATLMLKHTTTLGVREVETKRYTLSRNVETVHTEYGDIRKKISTGYGVTKEKFEFEDLKKIADENNISIAQLKAKLK